MIDEACYTLSFHHSSLVAQRKNGEATIQSWMWVHLVTLARRMYFFSSDILFDDLLISLILLGPFLVFGRLGRSFPPGTATK